jgi:YD repeat-containing protein
VIGRATTRVTVVLIAVIITLVPSLLAQTNIPIQYFYDHLGRLTKVVDQNGNVAAYHYDAVGNLLSITRTTLPTNNGPAILNFTPQQGPATQVVTILGQGFSATPSADLVQFNGTAAAVTAATATSLTVIVPTGATTGPISVTVSGTTATSDANFTVSVFQGDEVPVFSTAFSPADRARKLRRRAIAQTAVRSLFVVLLSPRRDLPPRLKQVREPIRVRRGGQFVRRVVAVRRHTQRTQPISHRVPSTPLGINSGVAFRGVRSLGHARQFVDRVPSAPLRINSAIIRRHAGQLVRFRKPVSSSIERIYGSVNGTAEPQCARDAHRRSRLPPKGKRRKPRVVVDASIHLVGTQSECGDDAKVSLAA